MLAAAKKREIYKKLFHDFINHKKTEIPDGDDMFNAYIKLNLFSPVIPFWYNVRKRNVRKRT